MKKPVKIESDEEGDGGAVNMTEANSNEDNEEDEERGAKRQKAHNGTQGFADADEVEAVAEELA